MPLTRIVLAVDSTKHTKGDEHMDAIYVVRVSQVFVGAGLLWLAVYYILFPALTDSFRQRVFELRAKLFLMVARGECRGDDEFLVQTRRFMNAMLFRAEKLTFVRSYLIFAITKEHGNDPLPESTASVQVVQKIEAIRAEFFERIAYQIFLTSPSMWIVGPIAVAIGSIRDAAQFSKRLRERFADFLLTWIPREEIEGDTVELYSARPPRERREAAPAHC